MRLKSFYGTTAADAMRLVRETLGENAIIIATRDDEMGGVRVTAAMEEPPALDQPPAAVQQAREDDASARVIETIARELLKHQTPNGLAERLLAAATQCAHDDPVVALGSAFDAHMKFQPVTEGNAGQPLMLIGPPGAGKTLCTAKFAIQATLAKKPAAIISTDTERAGGVEQLAAFTRLLKRDLAEVEDPVSLREVIALQQPPALVLIDTAAVNPFSEADRQRLRPFVEVCKHAILVLPADMDSSEAIDMALAFRDLGATRLLPTRLDIVRRLGGLLRVAFESRMPLANFSATSKVTAPPAPMNPIALAKLVLPCLAEVKAEKTKTKAGPVGEPVPSLAPFNPRVLGARS